MNKSRTYKKDKKISIIGRVKYINELGETSYRFDVIPGGKNIWAYYRHASAREIALASIDTVTETKTEVTFKIGWRDDIDTAMKIEFRGERYGITRIDDYEGYKKDLTIYAYKQK